MQQGLFTHPDFDPSYAASLPKEIRFGTSLWSYPGWQGIVYQQNYANKRDLHERGLQEYAAHPCFRTLGVDSAFYRPLSAETIAAYDNQTPEGFQWVSKVWEQLTIPVFPNHSRYGAQAGGRNDSFLDPKLFLDAVLKPYEQAGRESANAAFLFQFPRLSGPLLREKEALLNRLDSFFKHLPSSHRYAIELRNEELLTQQYIDILGRYGVTHCFSYWTWMPTLREQMTRVASFGGLTSSFYIARLLSPRGLAHKDAVERAGHFNELCDIQHELRDDLVPLAKRAINRKVPLFILIANRLEGCSPLSVCGMSKVLLENL